ncbi:hypothetical protein AYK26_07110 [Euryarchaeota archaeon SM23-78]|nr:MAG: hypothetical protein AYK26_07110 [Euryarchaeota archaeon SM23-78]MBW3000773.1 hypothetical protein [Candidatus Woesearchaeota archaeon]
MVEDISNKTIVVLVILTVIISILGTLVVLNEVNNLKAESFNTIGRGSSSSGRVSLEVIPREQPALGGSTGQVTLEILSRE